METDSIAWTFVNKRCVVISFANFIIMKMGEDIPYRDNYM